MNDFFFNVSLLNISTYVGMYINIDVYALFFVVVGFINIIFGVNCELVFQTFFVSLVFFSRMYIYTHAMCIVFVY